MNANAAAILVNPHPCAHIVYPYTDEGLVGQAVCLFASAGLKNGEGVILIMTQDHCKPIKLRLQVEGFNTDFYERRGQLICATSEELLAEFMKGGSLDEELFRSTVRKLVTEARASATKWGHPGQVRVFGEMVSQLRDSDPVATTRLEQLWGEAIKEHSVALLCTYSLCDADDHIADHLVALHTHSIQRDLTA
jgi:MEDS: MEthanogen/methylotroph, DcmR Sensory domain